MEFGTVPQEKGDLAYMVEDLLQHISLLLNTNKFNRTSYGKSDYIARYRDLENNEIYVSVGYQTITDLRSSSNYRLEDWIDEADGQVPTDILIQYREYQTPSEKSNTRFSLYISHGNDGNIGRIIVRNEDKEKCEINFEEPIESWTNIDTLVTSLNQGREYLLQLLQIGAKSL